jgi:hypothetical protein
MSFEWQQLTPLPNSYKSTEIDYDLELLPKAIKDAAEEVARFAKVPIASPAIVGLSCVAVAIGKKSFIVERQGLEHYPSLFLTLIAASGERKSPIFNYMKYPLDHWCDEQMEDYDYDKKFANSKNQIIDSAIARIKNQAKKKDADLNLLQQELMDKEDEKMIIPPKPSLYTTDTTEERLFQKMHERNATYAVMSGEGRGALDQILGKYTSGGGTGDALYLQGISGDTATRDRVGNGNNPEELRMSKPCLNVCIMVQPDKYQEVASHPSLRESGALARIWSIHLPSLVGTRFEEEDEVGLNALIMDKYNHMIKTILDAQPPETDSKRVHKVMLSEEVIKARRLFHNQIEKMMATGGKLEDVRDIASKTVSQTVKMAHILHIADNPIVLNQAESVINIDTWVKAKALGKFHLNEAVRIQRAAIEDMSIVYAKKLIDWIKKRQLKEVSSREVQQNGPRPRPKTSEATVVLNILCEYGYLLGTGSSYAVNPKIL